MAKKATAKKVAKKATAKKAPSKTCSVAGSQLKTKSTKKVTKSKAGKVLGTFCGAHRKKK